jgi:outer membrane protein TolC
MPRRRVDLRCIPALLLLALIPAASAGAQEAAAAVTLGRCLDLAMSQGTDNLVLSRNLAISREQYGISEAQAAYALSASVGESGSYGFGDATLLTTNSIGSGFNQAPQAGITLATPTTSLGLSTTPYVAASPLSSVIAGFTHVSPGASGSFAFNLNQVIWNGYPGGTARASLEKALLALRGRELSAETGRQNITSAVTQSYFIALGAQRNLGVRSQILEQQNALLAQMRAVRALQQATDIDLRTAEINAQSAEIELQSAGNDRRIASIRLAELIGWPREKELTVAEAEDPAVPASSVEDAVSEALKQRTDVQQIDLSRRAAAIDRDLIKGQTTPTVSLTGGANLVVDWKLLTQAGQGSVGVKVGLPILDAGAAGHQLEANRLQNEVYGAQESQLRARIATDVEEAFNLVLVQLQRLQIAKLNAEKMDLQFTLKKTAAQFGTATNQDILDASVNAGNAQAAVVTAQRNAQLAVLQLRNAMGY